MTKRFSKSHRLQTTIFENQDRDPIGEALLPFQDAVVLRTRDLHSISSDELSLSLLQVPNI